MLALRRSARTDVLTGLPNRAVLGDRLAQALDRLDRNPGLAAVLYLDIDGFKDLNDSRGHDVGDWVLREFAKRLSAELRPTDTLVRLGRRGQVSDPAGLGVARLLLGDNDPEHVTAFVETMVGPVRDWDERRGTGLVDTLEAWFASGGHLKDTARALHVHPNTVTQRLERIGELLGAGWRDPERALDLQLALRLARLQGP